MSWLIRTGTERNNVSYGGGSTTKGNYLKRTNSGRNNIQWLNINSNGTYNLLERYNTTRNGIRWNNLVFSFGPDLTKYLLYTNTAPSDAEYQMIWFASYYAYFYKIGKINSNGYTNISKVYTSSPGRNHNYINIYFKDTSTDMSNIIYQYSKITITGTERDGKAYSYTCDLDKSNGILLSYRTLSDHSYLSLDRWTKYSIIGNNQQDLLSMTFS